MGLPCGVTRSVLPSLESKLEESTNWLIFFAPDRRRSIRKLGVVVDNVVGDVSEDGALLFAEVMVPKTRWVFDERVARPQPGDQYYGLRFDELDVDLEDLAVLRNRSGTVVWVVFGDLRPEELVWRALSNTAFAGIDEHGLVALCAAVG